MKKIALLLACMFGALALSAQGTAQQELDRAIYLEEVDGDLDKAMELYQLIIKNHKNDRGVIAEALYRTGLVNEKLGSKKAVGYYENLIKNYGDQSRQVDMARKRLNTIYATMNTSKTEEKVISLRKTYSMPGRIIGTVSHNGKYLCEFENLNLYLRDLTSGNKISITTEGKTDSTTRNANPGVWSMDDTKIAFNWHHGKNVFSIKVWDRESGKTTSIVEPGEFIYPLNWTQDGKKILAMWSDDRRIRTHIGILNLKDGSRERLLTQGPIWNDMALISPDGRYVIHTRDSERGDKDLFLFSVENRFSQLISGHSAHEDLAIWSSDGKNIIFKSDRSGNPALYKWQFISGKMSGDPELIYEGINKDSKIQGINDNDEIFLLNQYTEAKIYSSGVDFGTGKIMETKELFDNATDLYLPRWSDDGNWISMYRMGNNSTSTSLLITDPEGNIKEEIEIGFHVPNRRMNAPKWAPDGKILIGVPVTPSGEPQIMLIDHENGEQETIIPPYQVIPVFTSDSIYYMPLHSDLDTEEGGILKVNRYTNEEELIYSCAQNTSVGPFLSLSPDMSFLLFRMETEMQNNMNDHTLLLLDLRDHSVKEIFEANLQDAVFWPPSWYADGQHIQFNMVDIDHSTGLFKDGEEVAVELNVQTGQYKKLPRLPLAKDETIPWRKRNLKYVIHPGGNKILYKKVKVTSNIWTLKY